MINQGFKMRIQSSLTGFSFNISGISIDVEFSDHSIISNQNSSSFNLNPSVSVTVENIPFNYYSLRDNKEKNNFVSEQIDNFFNGKNCYAFSDKDPEEANRIIYICIPKQIFNNEDIYIHENSFETEEDSVGSLAYAFDLFLEDDLFDIIMVEIEDNLF